MIVQSEDGVIPSRFRLIGPLPRVDQTNCPDHFADLEVQGKYSGHRSPKEQADIRVYHLANPQGGVAGFIAYQVAQETYEDSRAVFAHVHYMFIKPRYRKRRLSRLLLAPLIENVRREMHDALDGCGHHPVRIHSSSEPVTDDGHRTLRALETHLLALVVKQAGVELLGEKLEHPPGARKRAWELFKSATASGAA